MISEAIEAVWRLAMASEATKVVVRGNMHIIPRVMEVAYFKSEVKIDF